MCLLHALCLAFFFFFSSLTFSRGPRFVFISYSGMLECRFFSTDRYERKSRCDKVCMLAGRVDDLGDLAFSLSLGNNGGCSFLFCGVFFFSSFFFKKNSAFDFIISRNYTLVFMTMLSVIPLSSLRIGFWLQFSSSHLISNDLVQVNGGKRGW